MRQDTLLFLLRGDEICLAMKKRGFGAGKLNGVGGKVQPGEAIEAAAVREAKEEVGVVIDPADIVKVGALHFAFEKKPEWEIQCHVFFARQWAGEPQESEEMAPEWCARNAIPFERMWVDDKYWLPAVLRGDYVQGDFLFTEDGAQIIRYELKGAPRQ